VHDTIVEAEFTLERLVGAGGVGAFLKGADLGGLRGGWLSLMAKNGIDMHSYSYVPGVTVTGNLKPGSTIHVGGAAAAHGTLHLTLKGMIVGTLGGVHVTFH
jgi:hypothetical protein